MCSEYAKICVVYISHLSELMILNIYEKYLRQIDVIKHRLGTVYRAICSRLSDLMAVYSSYANNQRSGGVVVILFGTVHE